MSHHQTDPAADFVDHITRGWDAAAKLGLLGDAYVSMASLGLGEQGSEQVLVLTGQTVILAPTEGDGDLIEVHRMRIRSVEAIPGEGLLLRVPGSRWLHRLADVDAAYLRDHLVDLPLIPPTRNGGNYIPDQGWRHDQIAHLVGLIVMRAAEAEHLLGIVAASAVKPGTFDREVFGKTGNQLAKQLEKIGKSSEAIADIAERYRAWSSRRNQLVHSIRPTMENGRPDSKTMRPALAKKGQPPETLYTVETQDLPDLVDLWYAFNRLYLDTWHIYVRIMTGVEVKDLLQPNSVTGSDRLPPPVSRDHS